MCTNHSRHSSQRIRIDYFASSWVHTSAVYVSNDSDMYFVHERGVRVAIFNFVQGAVTSLYYHHSVAFLTQGPLSSQAQL